MRWLGVDSATDVASVAAVGPGGTVEERLTGARRHARELLPMIDRVLDRAGLGLAALDGIVLADGPGSFTGLRVGAAVVKALADTRSIPVWTAPSLMARALAAADRRETPVLVTSDALRGDVYAAVYRFAGGVVETIAAPRVCPRVELDSLRPRDAVEAGNQPADAGALIALTALRGGATRIADVSRWEPVYGRPAEAQAQWERTHGRPLPGAAGLAG